MYIINPQQQKEDDKSVVPYQPPHKRGVSKYSQGDRGEPSYNHIIKWSTLWCVGQNQNKN